MSHYVPQYCEKHGEWDMDVDDPNERCPKCKSLSDTSAEDRLPPLPEQAMPGYGKYTGDQMLEYGQLSLRSFSQGEAVATEWRSIDTAPKDGTLIILCRKDPRPGIPLAVADGHYQELCGKWIWVWPYIRKEPTHWMPLPAAPSGEKK